MIQHKSRISSLLLILSMSLVTSSLISILLFHEYQKSLYQHISGLCKLLVEDYPEAEEIVVSTLKKYSINTQQTMVETDFLKQYGYGENYLPVHRYKGPIAISLLLVIFSSVFFYFTLSYYRKRKRKRIDGLTDYLEKVNLNKSGIVMQTEDDDFSHLQDEIYKTVTNLRQTKELALKAKRNFADNIANIAHQLKTPITAAGLSLQLMSQESSSIYINQIQKQLERLAHLEEALLTLSQIDSGVLKLQKAAVDIFTVLSLAAENMDDLMLQKNVTVNIPEKESVEIWGDMEWTMQAIMNLMKNCLEQSPMGGVIYCDYSQNPLYTEILIWDEGKGFDKVDIPHLFERFYRGRTASGNGLGIGLSLARSIFELQNGTLTARNRVNGGACFEIRIYRH